MKKFKKFNIPILTPDMNGIQEAFCYNSVACFGGGCDDCLFCSDHLEAFTEWYNAKINQENETPKD